MAYMLRGRWPGSGLPDGGYVVRVEISESSVQPEAVQARIGHKGQHLAGELVSQSRHGLGQWPRLTTLLGGE